MAKIAVAPLVGAWIEIERSNRWMQVLWVAPLVGAWIEISYALMYEMNSGSLPSWERGLKYHWYNHHEYTVRRSPRGSVD